MRIPVCASDLPEGFNKIAKYLGRHWPAAPVPFSQARERLAVIMGYSSAYAVTRETVDQASIADLPWTEMLGAAVDRAVDRWHLERPLILPIVERTPWHEIVAGDRLRHRAVSSTASSAEQIGEVRLSCSASKHWSCRTSGAMRYTKASPKNPIWRLVAVGADQQYVRIRYFPSKPSADELTALVASSVSILGGAGSIVVPRAFSNEYPGVVAAALPKIPIRAPRDPADAGAHFVRRADAFLDNLLWALGDISEEQASPGEIATACGESGLLALNAREGRPDFRVRDDDSDFNVSRRLAQRICKLRGRDPEEGRLREERSPLGSQPHRIDRATPDRDMVQHLLSGGALPELRKPFKFDERDYEASGMVAGILAQIRQLGRTSELMKALGRVAVEYTHAPFVQPLPDQYGDGHGKHSLQWIFGDKSPESAIIGEAMSIVVDQPFVHIDREGRDRTLSFHILETRRIPAGHSRIDLVALPHHREVAAALQVAWTGAHGVRIDPERMNLERQFGGELEDIAGLMFNALGRMEWRDGGRWTSSGHVPKAGCLAEVRGPVSEVLSFYVAVEGPPGAGLAIDHEVLRQGFLRAEEIVNHWLGKWDVGFEMRFERLVSPTEATAKMWKMSEEERIAYRREARRQEEAGNGI